MQQVSLKPRVESGEIIPDEELVERSLRGEEDAFRHLYEKYRKPVYTAVYRIIPDPEEARDATQETFLAAHRHLTIWSPQRARFLPWICRIAINHAIDRWRSRRRRAEVPLTALSDTKPLCRSTMQPMEQIVEHKERLAEIRRRMESLPQPQQRFLLLRYCEGLKLREIAEKEGCKLGTVKSVLHRATNAMQKGDRHFFS